MPRGRKRKRRNPNPETGPEISFNSKKKKIEKEINVLPEEPPPPAEVRRSPNGYILPDPLPSGLVLSDLQKQKWKISDSIGIGGFGEIYSACKENQKSEDFVVKVEPHSNGPLFMEINFYINGGHAKDIESFKLEKKLSHLGIPRYLGSGSFVYRTKKYRFLVLPRYGNDLEKLSEHCGGYFSAETAAAIAIQVLDCLEYIHSRGFVHKDVKGSNLLLDRKNGNRVFLVDFGLCCRYTRHGIHKPFVHDRWMAHEGTLEYTSREGHIGCTSRRGDLEVFFYNVIEWFGGKLPWDDSEIVKTPSDLKTRKFAAFKNKRRFLNSCFLRKTYPDYLIYVMELIDGINFEEVPDYEKLRNLFRTSVLSKRLTLNFSVKTKDKLEEETDDDLVKNDSNQENVNPTNASSTVAEDDYETNSERVSAVFDRKCISPRRYQLEKNILLQGICQKSLENPTTAMLEVMKKIRSKRRKKQRSSAYRKRRKRASTNSSNFDSSESYLTPAMEAIIKLKKERELSEQVNNNRDGPPPRLRNSGSSSGRLLRREGVTQLLERNFNKDHHHRVLTRSHSLPRINSRSLRDVFDSSLGNISGFLKNVSRSLFSFNKE